MKKLTWQIKSFDALTNIELYRCLKLRQTVFAWEQHCAYIDCDDKDQMSYHLMGYKEGVLVAYSRIIPAGVSFEDISIGRVITHPKARRQGYGKELMQVSLEETERIFGKKPITIGAQKWLQRFYESFGFKSLAIEYLEDGIPHIVMRRE
jgi:ElaA protein